MASLHPRQHIQNFSDASALEPHWGYADRVVPCTSDQGSCEYLDLVYASHDDGMLYTGIMWAVIAGILFIWAIARRVFPSRPSPLASAALSRSGESQTPPSPVGGGLLRVRAMIAASSRRYLLPESVRFFFGHTTRLQVAVLAVIAGYLFVFSFVGMYYRQWITPVKNMPGVYNTRTTLGPWSDRVGVLAYALTPLSVLFASRESVLSVLTGVPYQSFMFLHRWLGYIIFAQSALHSIGWCVVEIRLYQPQPSVGAKWIVQTYMVWGIVAMLLLTVLFLLSTKWAIRTFGYELFRKAHYVLAMVYIGACYAHWENLACFLIPGLVLWGVDRIARLVRTALLHYNYLPDGSMGFSSAQAKTHLFPDPENGDVVRLDFLHPQQPWDIGQHFFLCFPELSIWQSHPMTPLSSPASTRPGQKGAGTGSLHSYVMRAKAGETRKLANLVSKRLAAAGATGVAATASPAASESDKKIINNNNNNSGNIASVSVILTGPYSQAITESFSPETNIFCVAGGTGVTFVLPVLLDLVRTPPVPSRKIEFVWAVRHQRDMDWVRPELDELRASSKSHGVGIDVYITRESKTRRHHHQQKSSKTAPEATATTAATAADKETATTDTMTTTDPVAPSSASVLSGSGGSCSSSSNGEEEEVREMNHVAVHRPAAVEVPQIRRPNMRTLVEGFVGGVARGSTTVFASGPLDMIADLRTAVASANDGGKVWRGEERFSVRLVSDDRVEW